MDIGPFSSEVPYGFQTRLKFSWSGDPDASLKVGASLKISGDVEYVTPPTLSYTQSLRTDTKVTLSLTEGEYELTLKVLLITFQFHNHVASL